jgi:tripartite ATP-independent transporter DctM subunit
VEILFLVGGALLLLLMGVRVAYVFVAIGLFGMTFLVSPAQYDAVGRLVWESTKVYALTAVPLFVLMAEILFRSGVSSAAYDSIAKLLRGVPGGAAYSTVAGSTVFAAMSGSSVANAATMGRLAGPDMVRHGYSKRLTFGSIASGGSLGILMPPSVPLILFGSLTGVSVGSLFLAGMVPAFMLAGSFMVVILVWSLLHPSAAPSMEPVSMPVRLRGLLYLLPIGGLIALVLGGIYMGVFSPTEAGGMGAFGALALSVLYRRFSWKMLWEAGHGSALLSSMILLIIAGASLLTFVMEMLSVPTELALAAGELGLTATGLLVVVALLYIVLGLFIETVSLIALTVPVVYPMLSSAGVDGVWLGIFTVLLIEIGLLTPPVGLNLYVLQKIPAGQTFGDIAVGVAPFVLVILLNAALIIAFPALVTWLPTAVK